MSHPYLALAYASERQQALLAEASARRRAREGRAAEPSLMYRLAHAVRRLIHWGSNGVPGERRLRGRPAQLRANPPGCSVGGGTR